MHPLALPSPSLSHRGFPDSSALSSCHNRVYQSLANLIRWADQVMLDGIDLEDKENVASVTSVIKAVLDGVKVLNSNSTKVPYSHRKTSLTGQVVPKIASLLGTR